jgi:hypothetical protein
MSKYRMHAGLLFAALSMGAFALAGGLAWKLWPSPAEQQAKASGGFRECADEVGIKFRMAFLPQEQGEKFKINLYDHGCGVAIGDFDGDGRDDIYFLNQLGPNALYRNNGDGTFTDVTEQAGVGLRDRICVGATFVDYDNSGRQSLYVTSTRGGNVLFRNMGNGKFKDVTKEAGLTHTGHSQTAVFFDYDNDGYLDLFLTNTAEWTSNAYDEGQHYWVGKDIFSGVIDSPKEYNVLYHNNGDGTFTDVTELVGLKGRGWTGDAAAFDYDGDGRMDLFVTSMFGRCQLYHNDGKKFTDVTRETLGRTPWGAVGAKAFDFNNDGRLDLFVVDMHSDMWMGPDREHRYLNESLRSWNKKFATLFGPRSLQDPKKWASERDMIARMETSYWELLFGNALYRNDGGGKFTEVSDQAGMETFWPWGIAEGDFDNDGLVDVFIPAGMGYPFWYWPCSLMMNQGGGKFKDMADELGIEPPARGKYLPERISGAEAVRSSRTAAVADFFGDGQLQIVVNNFNDQAYFFKNQLPRRNYIAFRLTGTKSNRDAIGALVHLYTGNEVMVRQVSAAGGYLAQSSKTLHFGLGERTQVDRIEIRWPSGRRETIEHPRINQLHQITEPAADG